MSAASLLNREASLRAESPALVEAFLMAQFLGWVLEKGLGLGVFPHLHKQ
jgi:hypothetical protein